LIGLGALSIAAAIGIAMVGARVQGVSQLGLLGMFSLFTAVVLAVAGVSIFALGATFNYLVSLFRQQPVHQGLFGRPIFDPPLDQHFGWFGLVTAAGGTGLAGVSLALSLSGWDISRLWFWLLISALLVLVGLQLVVSWVLMRVLERLSSRDVRINQEMGGALTAARERSAA
jgi:hypothetical protein